MHCWWTSHQLGCGAFAPLSQPSSTVVNVGINGFSFSFNLLLSFLRQRHLLLASQRCCLLDKHLASLVLIRLTRHRSHFFSTSLAASRFCPFSNSSSITIIMGDPRDSSSYSIVPRISYNTVSGVNGPLVILENVRYDPAVAMGNMRR